MQTIWKYTLTTNSKLSVPKNSQLLTIKEQNNTPQMWFLVDPEETEKEIRYFHVYGTGHIIQDDPGKYVGTFQLDGGMFIFHVFEEMPYRKSVDIIFPE